MAPAQTIQLCIDRCRRAKDGRGAWQAERSCAVALAAQGDATVASNTAAAARRIGEWLRGTGTPMEGNDAS